MICVTKDKKVFGEKLPDERLFQFALGPALLRGPFPLHPCCEGVREVPVTAADHCSGAGRVVVADKNGSGVYGHRVGHIVPI